jgi:hypothetical protein
MKSFFKMLTVAVAAAEAPSANDSHGEPTTFNRYSTR